MAKPMKPVMIRMPHELEQRLQRLAAQENNLLSQTSRRLLTKALDLEAPVRAPAKKKSA